MRGSHMDDIVFVETNATGHGVRALQHCAKLGLRSVFLTGQPEYYGADVLALADRWELVDTADAAAMLPHLRRDHTRGVLSFLDHPLLPTIDLAKMAGVPHPDREAVRRCRSKELMRQAIGRGPDQPGWQVLERADPPARSPLGYPCVLKPTDDSGSLGVTICADDATFSAALAKELQRSSTARGFALGPRLLVEEYIEGPEFSAELIFAHGGWQLLGLTRKLMSAPPSAVCVGHVFPASLESQILRRVRDQLIEWLGAVGLQYGAAHVEFRLCERGPVLIEINPRLGGALITELMRHAIAFDAVDYVLRLSCGLPLPALPSPSDSCAAALLYVHVGERGEIAKIEGGEELELMSNVLEFRLPRVGDEVRPLESDLDRIGHVIVHGRDENEALGTAELALGKLSIHLRARGERTK